MRRRMNFVEHPVQTQLFCSAASLADSNSTKSVFRIGPVITWPFKFSYVESTLGDSKDLDKQAESLQVAFIEEEKQCKQRSARHQDFEHQIGPQALR